MNDMIFNKLILMNVARICLRLTSSVVDPGFLFLKSYDATCVIPLFIG